MNIKRAFLCVMVFISLLLRLININIPIMEQYGFRQTQTAITVQAFVRDGFDLFNYQTPVLGAPWQIPFEFPIFQACAYFINLFGLSTIDMSGRITGILFFYLSALFLYLICGRIVKNIDLVNSIVLVYLLDPFALFWSRAFMIDYASVAFGLGYIYFFLIWKEGKKGIHGLYCIAFGALGYLTKITTMLPIDIFMAYYIIQEIFPNGFKHVYSDFINYLKKHFKYLSMIIIIVVVPVMIGYAWTEYADFVKSSSVFTEWLSSDNLKNWNYGTLEQRMSIANWRTIWMRVCEEIFPALLLIPLFLISNKKYKNLMILCVSCCFITISVFFNLYYVHSYYLIALMPFISILAGGAMFFLFQVINENRRYFLFFASVLVIILFLFHNPRLKYIYDINSVISSEKRNLIDIAQFIRDHTEDDELIIVTDFDWSSELLYYASRKGLMVNSHTPMLDALDIMKRDHYSIIVSKKPDSHEQIIRNWQYTKQIGFVGDTNIYRVSDKPILNELEIVDYHYAINNDNLNFNIEKLVVDPKELTIGGWVYEKSSLDALEGLELLFISKSGNSNYHVPLKISTRVDVKNAFNLITDEIGFSQRTSIPTSMSGGYDLYIVGSNKNTSMLYKINMQNYK